MIVECFINDECRLGYPEDTVFAVIDYHDGGYDGSGYAYAITSDKKCYVKSLGHSSYYGPNDNSWNLEHNNVIEVLDYDEFGVFHASSCDNAVWVEIKKLAKEHF